MNQITLPTFEICMLVTVDGSPIDLLDVCAGDLVVVLLAVGRTGVCFHGDTEAGVSLNACLSPGS